MREKYAEVPVFIFLGFILSAAVRKSTFFESWRLLRMGSRSKTQKNKNCDFCVFLLDKESYELTIFLTKMESKQNSERENFPKRPRLSEKFWKERPSFRVTAPGRGSTGVSHPIREEGVKFAQLQHDRKKYHFSWFGTVESAILRLLPRFSLLFLTLPLGFL